MSPTDRPDSSQWSWAVMEPELSEREKALRNVFVSEYLKDRDPFKAACRCGFQVSFAKEYAVKFMAEPYVLLRIQELKEKPAEDEKAEEEYNKRRILQALTDEAFSPTPSAARVAALRALMLHYGMDAAKKSEVDVNHRGGVMVVPGAITDVDAWEKVSMESQQKLMNDVRH